MQPPFYTPSFSQHLHSLAISGFYGRSIDADDLEFIEYVRKTGSANSSLPNTSAVLLEELEFWHLPYTLAPGIERHVGKRAKAAEPVDSLRQARSEAHHARRVIKEQENKIAEAELERERRAWKEAELKRMRARTVSDAEWEAHAPNRITIGAVVKRHYIPQWQLDEIKEAKTSAKVRRILERPGPGVAKALRKEQALERERQEQERKQVEAERIIEEARETLARAERAERWRRQQDQEADRLTVEARKTVARADALGRERRASEMLPTREVTFPTSYSVATLKEAIVTLLNRTMGVSWKVYDVMRALGCVDKDLMDFCLTELAKEGRLRGYK